MTKRDREYQKKQKKLEKLLRKKIRDNEKKEVSLTEEQQQKETS